MNVQELKKLYAEDERNFSFSDLRGADLRGSDLSGSDLRGSDLSGSDLSHCSLSEANLRGAYMSHCSLSGSDLRGADLSGAYLSRNATIISACLGDYQMHLHIGPDNTPMIHAGCRYFTVPEAKKHWAKGNKEFWTEKTEAYGERQRRMLKFLVAEAKERGWL